MAARISLLGGFRINFRGFGLDVNPIGARLVAAVALQPDRSIGRGALGALLWPDKAPERSAANVRSVLWRLPDAVKEAFSTTNNCLQLASWVKVDVDLLYEKVCDQLEVSRLSSPLLPGWYDDWVLAERDRLCHLQVLALESRAERYLEADQPDYAIDAALASIMIEPLREAPHQLVLRGHVAEGNSAEALAHLAYLRGLFRSELGADVSPQTLELLRECREVTYVRRSVV